MAAEVSEKIKKELQPQDIRFQGKNIFGHEILNIIPLYEDQKLEELKQKQASKEELQELNNSLQFSTEEEEQKEDNKEESYEDEGPSESQEEINEKNTWLPRRIP